MTNSAMTFGQSSVSKLFLKLPDRIFAPLASENRHRYWALLSHLYSRRFGPDAPIPPVKGFLVKEILQDIIDELELQDAWSDEDGSLPITSIEMRARVIFDRLHDCGWLRIENPRFDRRVSMHPAVSQFLDMMVEFSEATPVFISGKIRSIDANLKLVVDGEASGDVFSEAARQSRALLEHVRNTGTTIHDFMEELSREESTSHYVQRFFSDYIERVFIGDYRELKTREHPLSRRQHILEKVERIIGSDSSRNSLLKWYELKPAQGNFEKAQRLFERDIQRLNDLSRINEFLERLDDEIRKANKRAIAFIDYRMRSLMHSEHFVNAAIKSLLEKRMDDLSDPFPPGDMISPSGLAEPRKEVCRSKPSAFRNAVVSDESRAYAAIMNRARKAREVSPMKIVAFSTAQMNGSKSIGSDKLSLKNVSDVRMFQALSAIGLQMSAPGSLSKANARAAFPGFEVKQLDSPEVSYTLVSSVPFVIEKQTPKSKKGKMA